MVFRFFSSEQRQRSEKFDQLQNGMLDLIDDAPADEPVLEGYREGIRLAVAQAFLPNLRYGEVHLPKDQQDEGNIPLLPVHAPSAIQSGERLFLSGELIAPTPRKINALRLLGNIIITPAMHCVETDEVFYAEDPNNAVHAVSQPFWTSTKRGSRVVGRPVVMMPLNPRAPTVDRYFALEMMVHASDAEHWNPEGYISPERWRLWKGATRLHARAIVAACSMPMLLQIADKSSEPDQNLGCWSIWKEHGFSHDSAPDLSPDIVQKLGFLGLMKD